MKSDAIVNVRFFLPSEGGRGNRIKTAVYKCPMFIDDDHGFDCRLLLGDRELELGVLYENIKVKFLYPDVISKLTVGKRFFLWEMGYVAEGHITKIGITD